MPRFPVLLLLFAVSDARRALREAEVDYRLSDFNAVWATRAPESFADDLSFRRRLLDHERKLADDELQSFVVTLRDGTSASTATGDTLEARSGAHSHAIVGSDLLMHGSAKQAQALREQPEVRRVVPLLPELKVSPAFEKILPPNSTHAVSLNFRLVPLAPPSAAAGGPSAAPSRGTARAVASRLAAAHGKRCAEVAAWSASLSCTSAVGLSLRAESERTVVAEGVPRAEALRVASELSRDGAVLWVEPHAHYVPLNVDAAAITQSGSTPLGGGTPVGTTPIWSMGLHGEGEVIGVGDSGLDTGHCFFEQATGQSAAQQIYSAAHRKVVGYRAFADGGATGTRDHGTHVVGSILGESSTAGATGATEVGTAYKAKVSFTDIGLGNSPGLRVPNDLVNNFFNVDYANGARIHSNSWGANVNAYTNSASEVDEFMFENPDMLILFAAGNSGQDGAGSIGSPATCKNCLSVGASENPPRTDGNVAFFSSQGPAQTGSRIKPDVVAPGFTVTSANSNSPGDCPVTEMAGTSMATPVTAGNVALIRQYFRAGFYPSGAPNALNAFSPSGALLKAMVVHSGVSLTGTYQNGPVGAAPNNIQGFGRVQLDRVLFDSSVRPPSQRLFLAQAAVGTGDTLEYEVSVSGADPLLATELKATLVWTDPPAQPGAANPLVNNLDLEVIDGADTRRGNAGTSAGGAPDTSNTVEQVTLDTGGGTRSVTVRVKGSNVAQGGTQPFALVVTGPIALAPGGSVGGVGGGAVGGPVVVGIAPAESNGDGAAIAVALPLLLLSIAAGGLFVCRRRSHKGGEGTSTKPTLLLPAGWKQLHDPASGHPYYLDTQTGKTTWEAPDLSPAPPPPPPPPPPPGSAPLPPNWVASTDPGTGRAYYYNSATGASSWTVPEK